MARSKGKRKSFGLVRWILIIICAIVMCGSAGYILTYVKDKVDAEKDFEALKSHNLSELYAQNNDLIGWIYVPGTKIDYPVMQTPTDAEFYLHRDFNKEYSESGTPFLDAGSVVMPRVVSADDAVYGSFAEGKTLSVTWNWLIYGHHMMYGNMFAGLDKFEDQEFWQEHPTFTFEVYDPTTDTTYTADYEIFAVSRSEIKPEDSTAFKYYQYATFIDEETFNEYVAGVKEESSFDTGITPQFRDQLITLSTCAYHVEEGRFYIVGRQIKQ